MVKAKELMHIQVAEYKWSVISSCEVQVQEPFGANPGPRPKNNKKLLYKLKLCLLILR